MLLPKGRAFDVAMGKGLNAVFLAKMGYEVEGVDISAEAVSDALEEARKAEVTIRAEVADLEGEYVIKKGAYDVIICFRYLQRSLIPQIKNGLRKGGMVVYETFTIDQARFGRPKNPDYLLKHNELLDMFRDFRCLLYQEGILENRRAVARIIAEKTRSDSLSRNPKTN
ncbi:MAG: methyltransferase domain-containing protein [Deltaproteobacteria bacterium]|nr:MAG: methyltransferase domain-containing protein [Deltaproteobacteria bacterium]